MFTNVYSIHLLHIFNRGNWVQSLDFFFHFYKMYINDTTEGFPFEVKLHSFVKLQWYLGELKLCRKCFFKQLQQAFNNRSYHGDIGYIVYGENIVVSRENILVSRENIQAPHI